MTVNIVHDDHDWRNLLQFLMHARWCGPERAAVVAMQSKTAPELAQFVDRLDAVHGIDRDIAVGVANQIRQAMGW